MEVDRLSHHPCHRLSVPAAKLFWCRHCMEKFEDPISRWRHSKTCKTEGTLNMNKRKEQEAEAFKLFVESTTESEQETEMDTSPQLTATVSPPEKVPSVTQQTGTDLNCIICKKEFTSLDEMRAHVRTPCNKQDKHSDGYNRFPFITDSYRNIQVESAELVPVHNEFDSLLSLNGIEKHQNKEEALIAKLLSQWSQQKVSYKQPCKEMKCRPTLLKSSTATSLEQCSKYMQTQSTMVLDALKGGKGFSPQPTGETCGYISQSCKMNDMSTKNIEVVKDLDQHNSNYQNKKSPEKKLNSQDLLTNGVEGLFYVNSENRKSIGVSQHKVPDGLEVKKENYFDNIMPMAEDDNIISSVVGTNESHINVDVSKSNSDQHTSSDSFIVKQTFEQSDKENHLDACSRVSKEEKYSVAVRCFRPVRTIAGDVSSVINYDYTQDQVLSMEPEKKFTVLKDPETLFIDVKNQENKSSVAKTSASRKHTSAKVSKNKPKPVRAVIPIVNTGIRNTEQDDSDNDSTESVSKYQIYPPSPAKTRSMYKEPPFCSLRSTARTLKPTHKKKELMIKEKSKKKVQPKEKKQNVIKQQIAYKKPVKKSVKGSEKQTAKKQSIGKELKVTDKRKKPENKVLFHQLENEKSRSKPPKNLKCRLCDRVFDSVKQYHNHTRIPCKMKITRKWSQKVLRPNRSLPPAWKPKPGKKRNKEIKKPNLIPNNFRISSKWEPSKRIRKTSKVKNRPSSPQLSIVESSKEKRPLPHQQVEVSDLTEKELFLFHLGLMCSDDLPLNLCVRPREQCMPQPLAVSIESVVSDNLSDCYISPPVLERIDIDEHVSTSVVSADLSSNLEPPHLIPAVLCHESHSESNLLSSVHAVSMINVKVDTKSDHHRNIFDVISVAKQSALDLSDCDSSSFVKCDKEVVVKSSQCTVLNSQRGSQKSVAKSHIDSNSSNDLLNTKHPANIGKECFGTKSTDGVLVGSPKQKEKRNLFESLGWEMLSENSVLSLSEAKRASPLQRLAQQKDIDVGGLLSKLTGFQQSNDTSASPIKNTQQSLPSNNDVCEQMKFELQVSVLEPLKNKLLKHVSPFSSFPQVSPDSSHQSPIVVPTPRRPIVTKPGCSPTHMYSSSARCISKDVSGDALKNPATIPTKELAIGTGKCRQEPLSSINIPGTTVTGINHIVRKLQFSSCLECTNTGNESNSDLVSGDVLSHNNHVHHDDGHQNVVQIRVLHREESESSNVADLLSDMVQTICSGSDTGHDDVGVAMGCSGCRSTVCLTNGQCSCQGAVISGEICKDTSSYSCAQNKCLSNRSSFISTTEPCVTSGSGESSAVTERTDSGPSAFKIHSEECMGDFDEVDGDAHEVNELNQLEDAVHNMDAEEECSKMGDDLVSSDVTVEYVDHITSEMLDDSDDVTYIIIEQDNDICNYIDSVKVITNAEDSVATSSFVSVS